ncbi:hypothetical protein CVT26_007830 [Gymnopilus dilepis]|uniref:Uncharacterized protein n=1 Tax=Gymnopilus dilepis TaxID=231916 RepID=A0A409X824_9AGAR|nr:hypothetical protein CVT26_007830 [Gymnopilus dilepis]
MTPAVLISAGLDLEAEQRAVQVLSKDIWDHSRDRQKTALQLRKNALHRKINAWLGYLTLYIPGVSLARSRMATTSPDPELKPQDVTLWLPSQVPSEIPVNERLRRVEWKLRHAQAYESLSRLRQHLQARAYLYKFKDRFIRGQGANTRARNTIDAVTAKINAAASEYRAAYSALLALSPGLHEVEWKNELLPLRDQDIRDLSEGKAKESEGRRTISWIWKSIPVELQAEDDGVEKGYLRERVRVEWCQSRARSLRFSEEVDLLTEEMARVLRFFEWMTKNWLQKADTMLSKDFPKPLAEAYTAYAKRQAAMYTSLGARFKGLWADLPAHVSQMRSIAERELTTVIDGLFKAQKTRGRPPKNSDKQAKKKKMTHEDHDSSSRT